MPQSYGGAKINSGHKSYARNKSGKEGWLKNC
jgi:hypothetical protein